MALAAGASASAAVFLILYKAAQSHAPRGDVVAAMLLAAAGFNSLLALVRERGRIALGRTGRRTVLALAVGTLVGNVAVAESLGRIEPATTSVLMQTQVLFVALMARLALGEPITRRFAAGVVIAFAGVAVMQAPLGPSAAVSLSGVLFALAAAAGFGAMQVVTRKVIADIRPVSVNAARLWLATLVLLLFPGRAESLAAMPGLGWALAVGAAATGPFVSRLLLMAAVRHIPASQSVLFGLISPVLAFLLAWAMLGSTPSGRELVGGAIVLLGVALPLQEAWRDAAGPAVRQMA